MIYNNNSLQRDPDDKNKPADLPADNNTTQPLTTDSAENPAEEEPLVEKIKDALQDWSNKDQADQEFDDTRV